MTLRQRLTCPRCNLGIDDDGDGDCAVCASMTEGQAQRVRNGVMSLVACLLAKDAE